MPTTYNGIGTHYYGRKNAETRVGVCRSCGRNVQLTSYDTRLWFVVVFIPVIPLGRKHIIDQCSSCRRHYVISADEWETQKQLSISGAMEEFRQNPTPETAIAAHRQLIVFQQTAQALEFGDIIAAKFSDNAKVHTYLGEASSYLGKMDAAAQFYARALELRPDMPEARSGVALKLIREGRLDEARALLDFLEQPGAVQLYSLEPLEALANAYHSARRHAEALELFGKLLDAIPNAARHAGFRKRVKASEKALGRKVSILPKRKFTDFFAGSGRVAPGQIGGKRALFIVAIALALIAAGFGISNEYIRHHRTLHIVNAFKAPATVEVRGVGTVTAAPGVTELALPEGKFHTTISGPVREEVDFEIGAEYFDRWSAHPAWVLNVGSEAVLVSERAHYSRKPAPSETTFHIGERFIFFPEATHPFKDLPASLKVDSHEAERVLTHVMPYSGPVSGLVGHLLMTNKDDDAIKLCELHLRSHPNDEGVLRDYRIALNRTKQEERAISFLRAGLSRRPVEIEWHRLYQDLQKGRGANSQVTAEYDGLVQREPANSALLYLRGRICDQAAESREWFERARNADANNPWPAFALGYDRQSAGDWAGSRPLLARAVALRPDNADFKSGLFDTRLALGETAALEQELRSELTTNPLRADTVWSLCEVLAAQGRNADAQKELAAFEQRAARAGDFESVRELITTVRRLVLYSIGDFARLEVDCRNDRSPGGRAMLLEALIEEGRISEAAKERLLSNVPVEDPFQMLAISVAWQQAGNTAQAQEWRTRAEAGMIKLGGRGASAVALLRARELSASDWDALELAPRQKTIVLAACAAQHPQRRAELCAAARRLNVDRHFPFHLVQRLTADAVQAQAHAMQ